MSGRQCGSLCFTGSKQEIVIRSVTPGTGQLARGFVGVFCEWCNAWRPVDAIDAHAVPAKVTFGTVLCQIVKELLLWRHGPDVDPAE